MAGRGAKQHVRGNQRLFAGVAMTSAMSPSRTAIAFGLVLAIAGCAAPPASLPPLDTEALPGRASVAVPYYPPSTPTGAATATAAALDRYGQSLSDARLALIETDVTRELPGAIAEAVWEAGLSGWLLAAPESLLAQVADGHPVIVRLRRPDDAIHYGVLTGYDLAAGLVNLHGLDGAAAPMPLDAFLAAWHSGGWSLAVLPGAARPATGRWD